MAIFEQIIGTLTGERGLTRVRDRSIRSVQSAYDPSVLNPMADEARRQATEGIAEDPYRRNVLNQLFRPIANPAIFGGNQAAAIASTASSDEARNRALVQFETQLAGMEEEAKSAGRASLASTLSQQNQIAATRKGMVEQIRSEFEAERDARRMRLGTALAGFGIAAAGGAGAIGGAIGAGAQRGMLSLRSMLADLPSPTPTGLRSMLADVPIPTPTGTPAATLNAPLNPQVPRAMSATPGLIPAFREMATQPTPITQTAQAPSDLTRQTLLPPGLSMQEVNRLNRIERMASPANYYAAQQAGQAQVLPLVANLGLGAVNALYTGFRQITDPINPFRIPAYIERKNREEYEEYLRQQQGR